MGNASGQSGFLGCRQSCRGRGDQETEVNGDELSKPDALDIAMSSGSATNGLDHSLHSSHRSLGSTALPATNDGASASGGATNGSPGALALASNAPTRIWELPKHQQLNVMMFGMTGAGKSALGNLIAGSNVFEVADDTTSVTNLDSVMRYEAPDGSLVLMDTIGLGDTEIDQEKVVASIRDVALSAPLGIDVLLFVMRNGRITDDAIARLIYITEFLWGQACLLNLYIVVTFASRYLVRKDEAVEWITRQAEINWRFKHIYNLVGNNPNRFVFVDNPDLLSGEPNIEQRQALSYAALMRTLVLHPRDVIPPFMYGTMKTAHKLTEVEREELVRRQREFLELGRQSSDLSSEDRMSRDVSTLSQLPSPNATTRGGGENPSKNPPNGVGKSAQSGSKNAASGGIVGGSSPSSGGGAGVNAGAAEGEVGEGSPSKRSEGSPKKRTSQRDDCSLRSQKSQDLRERRERARRRKEEAEQALRKKIAEVRASAAFQEQALKEAAYATAKFARTYQLLPDGEPQKGTAAGGQATGSPVTACKRMIGSLVRGMGRKMGHLVENALSKHDNHNAGGGANSPGCLSPHSQSSGVSGAAALNAQFHKHILEGASEPMIEDGSPTTTEVSEHALDAIIHRLSLVLRGGAKETFDRLAGSSKASLSPIAFQLFLSEVDSTIDKFQAGGLWRRADVNCDGQLDFSEFASLFGAVDLPKSPGKGKEKR